MGDIRETNRDFPHLCASLRTFYVKIPCVPFNRQMAQQLVIDFLGCIRLHSVCGLFRSTTCNDHQGVPGYCQRHVRHFSYTWICTGVIMLYIMQLMVHNCCNSCLYLKIIKPFEYFITMSIF